MAEPISDELRLVQQMARSRYWRWMRSYLIARREQVFHELAETTPAVHQKMGAIRELNRLLTAPELVAKYLLAEAHGAEGEPEPAPPAPEWLGIRPGADIVE